VVNARIAIGKGRALVEDKPGLAFPRFHALFEDSVLLPEFQDFFFRFGEVDSATDWFKHAFPSPPIVKNKKSRPLRDGTLLPAVPPYFPDKIGALLKGT
jgi:hypothetical protein